MLPPLLFPLAILKAKQMPVTASKLRRLVMSKHPYIERNLGSVVSIIRHSIQSASAFEAVAEQLKEARVERVRLERKFRVFKPPLNYLLIYDTCIARLSSPFGNCMGPALVCCMRMGMEVGKEAELN